MDFLRKTVIFMVVFVIFSLFLAGCETENTTTNSTNTPESVACEEQVPQIPAEPAALEKIEKPRVRLETTMGNIILELDSEKAPITVANFLNYVNKGFYNNTIFHRVIKNFMIQGGGLTAEMAKKITDPPITNEASNGLGNYRGTISMARTSNPNSATSQFFINHRDNNQSLDFGPNNAGYAVFGKVIEGMEVVDQIADSKTTTIARRGDVPIVPIKIISAAVVE